MKILAIRGKNLASLEGEFEIDFKKEPLCSAGIFAIAGSTGSGKSTILDAMCIALYSRTPRLENIKNSNAIEVNGSNSVSEDSIKTILRRGKHEGYAEAEFKAVDGEEYRIRWSIARTNNSPAGNFKKASYDLTNLTTGERKQLSVKEHKELMPRLIGLTFEQFTRAVLLAQGNFAAFLKADENEKALILQTLTGTEIYSRISEIIYRRNEEAKKELFEAIEPDYISGITFSGGDPFLQAEALYALVSALKQDGYDIWVYTGYTLDQIKKDSNMVKCLNHIDVLVDGPYISELKTPNLKFRGSSNQKIHYLTKMP
jgi:DNA helicase HerA-like ATPase